VYWQALEITLKRALAVLALCSGVIALAIGASTFQIPGEVGHFRNAVAVAGLALVSTFFLGIIPVAVVGAPIYAWLWIRGKRSFLYALLLGIAPGALLMPVEPSLAFLLGTFGPVVAVLTHAFCRGDDIGGARSNNPLDR
jgi:hypothetical protein